MSKKPVPIATGQATQSDSGKRYLDEFKRDAVRLVTEERYTFKAVATAVGVSEKSLRDWIAKKGNLLPGEALLRILDKRTAEMLYQDLETARAKWLKEAVTHEDRKELERSSFLQEKNDAGQDVDFHALRMTIITNLTWASRRKRPKCWPATATSI